MSSKAGFGVWACMALAGLLALPGVASDAKSLLAEFEADRNAAYKEHRGQEISVSGRVTRTLKALGGMEITLDDAVTVKLGRDQSEVVKQIEEAAKRENDRVDKAREWRSNYERQRRRNSGGKNKKSNNKNKKPYNDSMNPHGAPKENLKLNLSATGTCKGVRSSKVLLDPVSMATLSAPAKGKGKGKQAAKGKNKGGKSADMEAALKRTSWNLKGTVFVENGQRYFAPDKGQYGVDVWPVSLPPAVGAKKINAAANNKKAEITVSFKAMARGDNGIRVDNPKVQSLSWK